MQKFWSICNHATRGTVKNIIFVLIISICLIGDISSGFASIKVFVPTNSSAVSSVSISDDGELALVAGINGATLWSLTESKVIKVLSSASHTAIAPVLFSDDSKNAITFSKEGDLISWNLYNLEVSVLMKASENTGKTPPYIAYSGDGSSFAVANFDGLHIYDFNGNKIHYENRFIKSLQRTRKGYLVEIKIDSVFETRIYSSNGNIIFSSPSKLLTSIIPNSKRASYGDITLLGSTDDSIVYAVKNSLLHSDQSVGKRIFLLQNGKYAESELTIAIPGADSPLGSEGSASTILRDFYVEDGKILMLRSASYVYSKLPLGHFNSFRAAHSFSKSSRFVVFANPERIVAVDLHSKYADIEVDSKTKTKFVNFRNGKVFSLFYGEKLEKVDIIDLSDASAMKYCEKGADSPEDLAKIGSFIKNSNYASRSIENVCEEKLIVTEPIISVEQFPGYNLLFQRMFTDI